MTHDVLKASEAWSDYEEQGTLLRERRRAIAQHRADLLVPYEQAVREHKAAVAAAVEGGSVPPLAPEPPDLRHLADADALVMNQERAHRERKDAVLVGIAAEVLEALRDREDASNARLAQVAPDVRRLLAQRIEDLSLYAMVIAAQDRHAGLSVHPSRAERVSKDIGVDALLSAAEADVSLFRFVDLPRGRADKVEIDYGNDDSVREIRPRRLGMSGPGFGNVDRMPRVSTSERGVGM